MSTNQIQKGLQSISNHLVRMAFLAEEQIIDALRALAEKNVELAARVERQDNIIDDLQRIVEDQSIKLIATQQPVAEDLRSLFTTIKIVTDVERMADYAVSIARIAILLKNEDISAYIEPLQAMATTACSMLRESIDAYTTKDEERAIEITKWDDTLDQGLIHLMQTIFRDLSQEEGSHLKAVQLNFIAKYLERIGDHATNICEWTIYIVDGDYVELNI